MKKIKKLRKNCKISVTQQKIQNIKYNFFQAESNKKKAKTSITHTTPTDSGLAGVGGGGGGGEGGASRDSERTDNSYNPKNLYTMNLKQKRIRKLKRANNSD